MIRNRFTWLIGGPQGSGVDRGAAIFAQACACGGLHVFGQREYYSNIMGEHSYFLARIDEKPVRCLTGEVALLVSFDAATVFLHLPDVVPGGGVVYDPKLLETPLGRIPSIEHRAKDDLKAHLESKGLGETMGDLLGDAEKRGVRLFPVPYDELLGKLAGEAGRKPAAMKRLVNVAAIAASLGILGYDIDPLKRAVADLFKGKGDVVALNVRLCEMAYEHVREAFAGDFPFHLETIPAEEPRIYITGAQAVALGKVLAGCSFQTYYPISPATDESAYLEAHEVFPEKGAAGVAPEPAAAGAARRGRGAVIVVQTEDEISGITMATGAALAGARAAASTSGPGFSLMVEGLGWAGINEVPVVITLYQRGSPSTGLPTRSEQGDLRCALHAGHGEFPRIVLASGDIEESFHDTVRAFNYAERYQLPVIHLLDKSMASSSGTYPVLDTAGVCIDRGEIPEEHALLEMGARGGYRRFEMTESGISPRAIFGMKGGVFWNTGDEHDEWGHITEDPVVRTRIMEKRSRKLDTAAREIPAGEKYALLGEEAPETIILSWGSPKAAILEAMERLAREGHRLGLLQVRVIWPLPAEEIKEILLRAKRRVAVENNFSGQLAGLVREQTGIPMDYMIVKYNGRPMSVGEVHASLKQVLDGTGPGRMVLTHGR